MPRICLITTTHPGCLSRLTCQSGCQIFSFISGHVSQGPQQRNTREEGRQCPAAASSLHGSFTRLGLAVVCPRAHHVKPWKCTKLPVGYLSFLLMPCASVLTVNSHLKQPCATELSAGNVSELHRPFKILPWMKGHQSARRDPYLWVRSPRQIHSITFFFFEWVFLFQYDYAEKLGSKENQANGRENVDCVPGRRLCPEPTTFTQMLQACWWGLRQLGLLLGSLFYWMGTFSILLTQSLPAVSLQSGFTHNPKVRKLQKPSRLRKQPRNWEESVQTRFCLCTRRHINDIYYEPDWPHE